MDPKERQAFPSYEMGKLGGFYHTGLTLREYFAAHAPAEPAKWFEAEIEPAPPIPSGQLTPEQILEFKNKTKDWRKKYGMRHSAQWPWAWADAVLAAGEP